MTAGKTEKNKQITTIISLIIVNKFQLEKNDNKVKKEIKHKIKLQ